MTDLRLIAKAGWRAKDLAAAARRLALKLFLYCSELSELVRHVRAPLSRVEGGRSDGVMEVGDHGAKALGVGVRNGSEGKDEGHQDDGPGEFVVGSDGKVAHTAKRGAGWWPNAPGDNVAHFRGF